LPRPAWRFRRERCDANALGECWRIWERRVSKIVVWEKISAAKLLFVYEDDELTIEPSRWVGSIVVMIAFRGRVFVEDPDDPDFESARLR